MLLRPVDATFLHPPGGGPFLARGLVYVASLNYVEKKTPGGLQALLKHVGDSRITSFFEQLFITAGKYDIAPLIALHVAAADLEGTSTEHFCHARSRESAEHDIKGIYRMLLRFTSTTKVAEKLPHAFNRYFSPCRCRLTGVSRGQLRASFAQFPEPTAGWYVQAVEGFVSRALEMAGAEDVRFKWSNVRADDDVAGVSTVALDVEIAWT